MADPNQTPIKGDWLCQCSGCQKSIAAERKQLIELFESIGGLSIAIDLIKNRMPKPRLK
jgi:coenzyme F420-reducing hydrogenase gamma subunit